MKNLIRTIDSLIEDLKNIQLIFISNPTLDRLSVEYYAAEDDGDVNTYFSKLTINDAVYENDDYKYGFEDIEDGILSEVDLQLFENSISCFLSFSSDTDPETLTILRDEIINLDIKDLQLWKYLKK